MSRGIRPGRSTATAGLHRRRRLSPLRVCEPEVPFFRAGLVTTLSEPDLIIGDSPLVLRSYLADSYKLRPGSTFNYWPRYQPVIERGRHTVTISARQIGPISTIRPYAVDFDAPACMERGFAKRLACTNQVSRERLAQLQAIVRDMLKRYRPLPRMDLTEDLIREWATGNHRYNRRKVEQLVRNGMDAYNGGIKRDRILRCKGFIKRELYSERKEPRIISSRSDYFKAMLGPYVRRIEEQVYQSEHFIKHLHPAQVAERLGTLTRGAPFIYETDYSSFEGSFSAEILKKCEWKFLRYFLQNNPRICSFAQSAVCNPNVIISKAGHAISNGSRMSGELWTSLGNGFMNMCLMELIAKESGTHIHYLVEGDDGVIVSPRALDVTCVAELGFRLKLDVGRCANDVSFCGLAVHEGKLVPDIKNTLMKFGYDTARSSCQGLRPKRMAQRLRAFSLSLSALGEGIPVLQSIAHSCIHWTRHVRARRRDLDWWEDQMGFYTLKPRISPISDSMREFVYHRVGIGPAAQLEIENWFDNHDNCPYLAHIDLTLCGIPRVRPSLARQPTHSAPT